MVLFDNIRLLEPDQVYVSDICETYYPVPQNQNGNSNSSVVIRLVVPCMNEDGKPKGFLSIGLAYLDRSRLILFEFMQPWYFFLMIMISVNIVIIATIHILCVTVFRPGGKEDYPASENNQSNRTEQKEAEKEKNRLGEESFLYFLKMAGFQAEYQECWERASRLELGNTILKRWLQKNI